MFLGRVFVFSERMVDKRDSIDVGLSEPRERTATQTCTGLNRSSYFMGDLGREQLAQANDFSIHIINVICLRFFRQTWHTEDIPCDGNDHLRTGIDDNVLDE